MDVFSPIEIAIAHVLRSISYPFWWGSRQWLRRSLRQSYAVEVRLTASTIHEWRMGRPMWEALNALKDEADAKTLLLVIQTPPVGWSNIYAFRALLKELKQSGKSIFVSIQTGDARALAMVACADQIWLQPGVEIFWSGMGGRHIFWGGMLEKVGVTADIVAAGAYKSFGETYCRTEPSEANRDQMLALYGDLQEEVLLWFSEDRGIEIETLQRAMGESPLDSAYLESIGLLEGEKDLEELRVRIQAFTHADGRIQHFSSIVRWRRWMKFWHWGRLKRSILVIHLDGSIVDFEAGQEGVVADRTVELLHALGEWGLAKAIVLYVNSPGGSAIASDRIAREIERLQKHSRVYVYMGNVAASGGYYISAGAAEIWASPTTITGSIGVVGGKLAIGKALETFGVQGHILASGPDTDFLDWWTPFSEQQRERFRASLERTYLRFKKVVAKGRRMPLEQVEVVAQGRVWTGRQALLNGLIDRTGSFEDCIRDVALQNGIHSSALSVEHIFTEPKGWRHWVKGWLPFSLFNPVLKEHSLHSMVMLGLPRFLRLIAKEPSKPMLHLPFDVEE